jgi:hypothetical protein
LVEEVESAVDVLDIFVCDVDVDVDVELCARLAVSLSLGCEFVGLGLRRVTTPGLRVSNSQP